MMQTSQEWQEFEKYLNYQDFCMRCDTERVTEETCKQCQAAAFMMYLGRKNLPRCVVPREEAVLERVEGQLQGLLHQYAEVRGVAHDLLEELWWLH